MGAPTTYDVALSGGGIRAALFSGGALLALKEGQDEGALTVESIHAVSGSSLLLARLLMVGDELPDGIGPDEARKALREDLAILARKGFVSRFGSSAWRAALLGAVGVFVLFPVANWISRHSPGAMGEPFTLEPPWWLTIGVGMVVGVVGYQLLRRNSPFDLLRGRRPFRWLWQPLAEYKWFGYNKTPRSVLLPTDNLGFNASCVIEETVVPLDPWDSYRGPGFSAGVPLGDLARASAAVPVYSAALYLKENVLVDGGVIDNLGVSTIDPATPNRILVVDAAVSASGALKAMVERRSFWADSARPLRMGGYAMAVVVVGALAGGLLLTWNTTAGLTVLLLTLVGVMLFAGAMVLSPMYGSMVDMTREIKSEARAIDVAQAALKKFHLAGHAGRDEKDRPIVELSELPPFDTDEKRSAHDLKTKLSRVRGDTAAALIRAGYEATCARVERRPSSETLSWLEELDRELEPSPVSQWVGRTGRRIVASAHRLLSMSSDPDRWRPSGADQLLAGPDAGLPSAAMNSTDSSTELSLETVDRLHHLTSAFHVFIYFCPEAPASYAEEGIEGWGGYFASRTAAMGPLPAEMVIATFYNFSPQLVAEAMEGAWETSTPQAMQIARWRAAARVFDQYCRDALSGDELAEALEIATEAVDGLFWGGRPMAAGNHAALALLDRSEFADDDLVRLWQLDTIIREWRGDTHIGLLVAEPLSPAECTAVTDAQKGGFTKRSRAWSEAEWDVATAALVDRGLMAAEGGLTAEGKAWRNDLEERTNRLSMPIWSGMDDAKVNRFGDLIEKLVDAIAPSGYLKAVGIPA